jgi:hypothetical protein
MRKIISIAVALLIATPALAEGRYHHGQGFAGVAPRHHHGGDAGAAIFGGLVGGLIIGGMINQMNQPRYVYQEYYEPYCRQVIVNRYWNGWQWVSRVATVCD